MKAINIDDFYTQEVRRLLSYRHSMEMTRNLSVMALAGMAYFAFGFPEKSSHLILILGSLIIFLFQVFESCTSQHAETSAYRVRQIENNVLIPALDPSAKAEEGWEKDLAVSLGSPKPVMNFFYAFSGRIWKGYFIIFLTLDVCWFSKLYLFPHTAASWTEFVGRLEFGALPGWVFLAFPALFWLTYTTLTILFLKKYKGKITDF
jgi:uncharacterized membrane protein